MGGEAGLKSMPLASVLKVGILKLHFTDRPPNENMEKTAAFAGGGGAPGGPD